MTNSVAELYDLFNLQYNNLASEAAPNIDDFNLSLLFTKAQEEVVYNHIKSTGNKYQQGAEESNKRLLELSPLLIDLKERVVFKPSNNYNQAYTISTNSPSLVYKNIICFLNESFLIEDTNIKEYRQIIPINYGEYEKQSSKPGGEPLRKQVWKLMYQDYKNGDTMSYSPNYDNSYFIFNQNDISSILKRGDSLTCNYIIRGYKKPKPIIFNTLQGSLYVEEEQLETDFYLPLLKREIVQRAVEIAKGTYSTDEAGNLQLQNQLNLGQRSE